MRLAKNLHVLITVFLVCSIHLAATAQNNRPQRYIYLIDQQIATTDNVADWTKQHKTIKEPTQVLVQFSLLPNGSTKQIFADNGIELLDYIPDNAYVAILNKGAKTSILNNYAIYISNFSSDWKIGIRVKEQTNSGNKSTGLILSTHSVVSKEEVYNTISKLGGSVTSSAIEEFNKYKITLPTTAIQGLADWYGTKYLTLSGQDIPLNFESKTAVGLGGVSAPQIFGGLSLKGDSMVIGVGDNVSGNYHIDLKDRIINYNPAAYTDHGVHINGIVGGAGIIDPQGEGMAPHATLVDHYFSFILDQTPFLYQAYNMTITNNSYAAIVGNCGYSGVYDALSEMVDELALSYDDVLHVFASGNDGYLDCSPLPKGFGTVTGGYQPAKNNVVVTSTNKWFVNAYDGSRGPVRDGRLKPEITAVGVEVNSTTKQEEYLVAAGTSMASPEVAGGAAIIAQKYKQNNAGIDPKSDIVKTLLLNGTTDIGLPGPDYTFGFGFMNVARSIQMLDNNQYVVDTINNGGAQNINITVPANTAKLKVMLYYHDPAASPSSSKQLVNDLDVEVVDPNNIVHLPLVPNPSVSTILNTATEQVDRLNNCEQVTINNPSAGSYTINVKAFSVPTGRQRYVVAYGLEPEGIELTYPRAGAQVKSGDSLRIYWYASDASNDITIEYSTDNGGAWNTIDNSIPADTTYYIWYVPENINSGKCLMRISRNGTAQTYTSGQFAMNNQTELRLRNTQCPGYMNLEWAPVPSASAYEILQKVGPQLVIIDTTSDTTYAISGLNINEYCYAAVRPILDGLQGYRSLAIHRLPNDGDCVGNISNGDLYLNALTAPINGRENSSTTLTANENISVAITNLDDVIPDSFKLSYSINNAAWVSQTIVPTSTIQPKTVYTIGTEDLSALGSYEIRVAIENLGQTDPVTSNDSLNMTIRHLKNQPIDLTNKFVDGFETSGIITLLNDSLGFTPDERWEFYAADTGRMRSFAHAGIVIEGDRSISMDAYKNSAKSMGNTLRGVFNLSNYDTANAEVRLEFDYVVHGTSKYTDYNVVNIKEHITDGAKNVRLYQYNLNRANVGDKQNSGSLSVTDALQSAGFNFTSDIALEFNQWDSTCIGDADFGAGITIDNVTLYTVQNDIQLLDITSPTVIACERPNESPVIIKVRNGVNQTLNNINVYYQLNNEPIVNETITSLAGKQTLIYTFNKMIDISAYQGYTLKAWVVATGDSYTKNDSILDMQIRTQPRISTFPYKEDFENGDGSWYTSGIKSSWQYGIPAGNTIVADTQRKAWVTNLTGNYNDGEWSYLTSPCFDISKLNYPTLSFKTAIDIENCGVILCDAAYAEYTTDGITWQRLDKTDDTREYTNWYNDTGYRIWSEQGNTAWRKAIISLPRNGGDRFQLRFAMKTDEAANFEGIAIDDILIEDRKYYAGTNDIITISPNPTRDGNINIEWAAAAGTEMQIAMTDILGKQVYRSNTIAVEGYNKTSLQTPHFSSGVYLMHIIIGNKEHTRKIVYQ